MNNSALIEAITSLSAWEVRNFQRWLDSPAFNARKEHKSLFEHLQTCPCRPREPQEMIGMVGAAAFVP